MHKQKFSVSICKVTATNGQDRVFQGKLNDHNDINAALATASASGAQGNQPPRDALPVRAFAWVGRFVLALIFARTRHFVANAIVLLVFGHLSQGLCQNTTLLSRVTDGQCNSVHLIGDIAYVGNGSMIDVVNLENPLQPERIGRLELGSLVGKMDHSDNLLLVLTFESFSVVDISEPSRPRFLGACSLPSDQDIWFYKDRQLEIIGSRAYVRIMGKLLTVDFSDPNEPRHLATLDRTISGLAQYDNFLLTTVASHKLMFLSFDEAGVPYLFDSLVVDRQMSIQELIIKENIAWVDGRDLMSFDLTDVNNIQILGQVHYGPVGHSMVCLNDRLYGSDDFRGIKSYDISNPAQPMSIIRNYLPNTDTVSCLEVGNGFLLAACASNGLYVLEEHNDSLLVISSYETSGSVQALCAEGDYLYSAEGYAGLRILDISNPSNINIAGNWGENNHLYQQFFRNIKLIDNYAIKCKSDYLSIFYVSNIEEHELIQEFRLSEGTPGDILFDDTLMYVAHNECGLSVLDISDINNISEIGNIALDWSVGGDAIEKIGTNIFVIDEFGGIRVYDVNDFQTPVLINEFELGHDNKPYSIAVKDEFLFVTSNFGAYPGLFIIDASNPEDLQIVNQTLMLAGQVRIEDNFLYVTAFGQGLIIYDVSNPIRPQYVGGFDTEYLANTVSVKDGIAYVGDLENGIYVIRNDRANEITRSIEGFIPNTPFEIYPNPCNSVVKFEFNQWIAGHSKIMVVDNNGNILLQQYKIFDQNNSDSWTWDVSNIPNGTYYCVVKFPNYKITKPIVVIK